MSVEPEELLELDDRDLALLNDEDWEEVSTQSEPQPEPEPEGDPVAGAGKESDPPEADSGKDAATGDGGDWITDADVELGKSYGFTRDRMKVVFGSREEFERQARAFDQELTSRPPARPPARRPPPPKPPAGGQKEPPKPPEEIDLDPEKFKEEGYDQRTIELVKFNRQLKQELEQMKPAFRHYVLQTQRAMAQANERATAEFREAFHDQLDGEPEELFGRSMDGEKKPVKLTPEQHENRRKVWEAVHHIGSAIQREAAARGERAVMPSPAALRRRAMNMVFGEELSRLRVNKYKREVAEQSRQRRPAAGAPRRTRVSAQQGVDEVTAIANDPEVVAAWNSYQEA